MLSLTQSPPNAAGGDAASPDEARAAALCLVIDGEFEDWKSTPPTLIDPADAPDATIDFGEIRISHDDRFVHLLIDVGRNVNLQGMDAMAMILLDADGDAKTGRTEHGLDGVDVIIDLSPQSSKDRPGMGIGLRSTTHQPATEADPKAKLNPYDIGLMFSPTYAGRRFEFRFERGATLPQTPALFKGDKFAGKLVGFDLGGNVIDEVEAFTYQLSERAKTQASPNQTSDPLARTTSGDVRVMSWNVERGVMFTNPQPFQRILKSINPDVFLLQELKDTNTAEQLRQFLDETLPLENGSPWNVLVGSGGGDLRCAVASRLPLQECTELAAIQLLDRPNQTVRIAGAWIEQSGKRLLAASIHLKCCGRADGPEDHQRIAEVQLIQQAINNLRVNRMDGLIIAGDFNLVGSRDPLEMLASGLDVDRSNLTPAPAYQLDGLSNTTWSDRKQPFTPGRLDFLLASDASLKFQRSFVFDSRDLSVRWLMAHHVESADTAAASDHMPVVADVLWTAK